MNIALVDDSATDRNSLKLYLHVYLKKHRITAELEEFTCAEEYLEAAQHRTFDVVFLDIYMKQKTGMDAARELFAAGSRTKLIFLSSSTDFLRQSYSVRAVYYLVKPLCRRNSNRQCSFWNYSRIMLCRFWKLYRKTSPAAFPPKRSFILMYRDTRR